ncbi:MAG: CBS domain-containing protein [Thermoproteus sp. AZ2]|jgi:CBS domain-containing protein|uniref:CBS domain-containing protein n=1 Tax=Thermoproteus sp. AZ2 TaxID=1609232 RepID=A0ACC6V0J7_9CREN|nr:MAG: hypothetical protein TU35_04210 [Thermoproteus sp. AZ2]
MSIKSFIKRPPISLPPTAKLRDVVRAMAENNVGLIVIVEGDRPVGVVSERDVIRALARGIGLDADVRAVGTFEGLVEVKLDAPVYDVVKAMRERGIRHVLVVDDEGRLKGVVSVRDMIEDRAIVEAWKHAWPTTDFESPP